MEEAIKKLTEETVKEHEANDIAEQTKVNGGYLLFQLGSSG